MCKIVTSSLKEIRIAVVQRFQEIKSLLKHSYSCYMLAAIQYNSAMFHIFSGPLFANVEGYVYIDLIIWGISPLIYLFLRQSLFKLMKPEIQLSKIDDGIETQKLIKQILKQRKQLDMIHKRRLLCLVLFATAIAFSYMFMNYSQTFNWNYFTRIINLDLGYLIFDFACRGITLIIQIEQQEEIQQNYYNCKTEAQLSQMKRSTLLTEKCQVIFSIFQIYCNFKNFAMFLSYSIIFLLFSNGFDVSLRYSGQKVLALTSAISCFITFTIPFLYFFHFKNKYFQKWNYFSHFQSQALYNAVKQNEEKSQNNALEIIEQGSQNLSENVHIQTELKKIKKIISKENKPCSPPTNRVQEQIQKSVVQKIKFILESSSLRRPICIFLLIFFSLIVNISYLALWIMQTLKHQQNYIQYNETILISSVFFMVGSGLFGVASKINQHYPFEITKIKSAKDQLIIIEPMEWSYYITKVFLFILGLILLLSFTLIKNSIYMLILSTIGFGFHLALANFVYFKVAKIIQELDIQIDLEALILNTETFAYLLIPVLITLAQVTIETYAIYGWMSSTSMILAAVIL